MATLPGEILVIDHNRSIREMIIAALEFENYWVTGAAHVAEALSILETWTPHLILMDVWLPLQMLRQFQPSDALIWSADTVPWLKLIGRCPLRISRTKVAMDGGTPTRTPRKISSTVP